MTAEPQPLLPLPTPSKCQGLTWTTHTSPLLEALGIEPTELTPAGSLGLDLRPRQFSCPWLRVRREGPALYLRWRRLVTTADQLLEQAPHDGWGTSQYVGPPPGTQEEQWEQAAGDALLEQVAIGTGAPGQALMAWLSLWGWQRPAKGKATPPPPPMVV